MSTYKITVSQLSDYAEKLRVGDKVLLSGEIFTARDAAHKRFFSFIEENKPLPVDIKGSVVYYAGPTPAPEGKAIGSCGPTTSGRMDKYAVDFYNKGLLATIGKGERSIEVKEAIQKNNAKYFTVIGGIAALLSEKVTSKEIIAFEDLGAEALYKLTVKDLPIKVELA